MLMKVTFALHGGGWGAGGALVARWTIHRIRRLELSIPPLLLHLWEAERGEGQVKAVNDQ